MGTTSAVPVVTLFVTTDGEAPDRRERVAELSDGPPIRADFARPRPAAGAEGAVGSSAVVSATVEASPPDDAAALADGFLDALPADTAFDRAGPERSLPDTEWRLAVSEE
ncbi:hypothetical protein GCM10010533_01290 [Mycolicibacterium pallens]